MSIAVSIPSNSTLSEAGLNGISRTLLTDANSVPSPKTSWTAVSSLAITGETSAIEAGVDAGTKIDPLTPRGLTASGAAALTNVIAAVTETLKGIQSSTTGGLTQLVQSPGFNLLLQVLGAGDTSPGDQFAAATSAPAVSDSSATSSLIGSTESNPPATQAPYFQKLLGELESTYKTSAASTSDQALNASEFDAFLKWLSINGTSSVAANA